MEELEETHPLAALDPLQPAEFDPLQPAGLDPLPQPDSDVIKDQTMMRKNNAFRLLQMKEEGRLTQKSLDTVVQGVSLIVRNSVEIVKASLAEKLEAHGIQFDHIQGLEDLFDSANIVSDPFKDIANFKEQVQYYKENFNLVVSIF
jgi:hypothetical protein